MKRAKIREIFPDATDEQISDLLGAVHAEVDTIRDENDDLKSQLEEAKSTGGKNADGWKKKHDDLKAEFEGFKQAQAKEKAMASKKEAIKELLTGKLSDKGLLKALKYADYDSFELDENGRLKDAGAIEKAFSEEWAEYLVESKEEGVGTENPGGAAGGSEGNKFDSMSLTEKMGYANEHPSDPSVQAWLNS